MIRTQLNRQKKRHTHTICEHICDLNKEKKTIKFHRPFRKTDDVGQKSRKNYAIIMSSE